MKDASEMSAGEINRELDKLAVQRSKNTAAFIAAGRGYECPSEHAVKNDKLSVEANTIADRQFALRSEIERRYGPGAPARLPKRFGPLKNKW